MLSMGFADDVERIFGECPAGKAKGMGGGGGASAARRPTVRPRRVVGRGGAPAPVAEGRRPQTLLFSATSPGWIKKMTRRFMTDHVFVDVVGDATQQAATTVTHKGLIAPRSNDARASLLEDIISVELSQRQGQVTDEQQNGGGRVIELRCYQEGVRRIGRRTGLPETLGPSAPRRHRPKSAGSDVGSI